jgi:hypothetical protein
VRGGTGPDIIRELSRPFHRMGGTLLGKLMPWKPRNCMPVGPVCPIGLSPAYSYRLVSVRSRLVVCNSTVPGPNVAGLPCLGDTSRAPIRNAVHDPPNGMGAPFPPAGRKIGLLFGRIPGVSSVIELLTFEPPNAGYLSRTYSEVQSSFEQVTLLERH